MCTCPTKSEEYGMDYKVLCIVDSTFVLATFIPFHSSKEIPLLQVRCTEECPFNLLNMNVTLDP